MAYRTYFIKRNQSLERCQLPDENADSKFELSMDILNLSIPIEPRTQTFSPCTFYKNGTATTCSEYIFDNSTYTETSVKQFKMVCSRSFLRATADACFMVGVMIGSLVFGQLSDRQGYYAAVYTHSLPFIFTGYPLLPLCLHGFGRKKILCISMILQFIFGVLITFTQYYVTYVIARILIGTTLAGGVLTAYVLGTELVGPKDRLYTSIMCHFFFAIGYMLTALYAYYIRHWRYLVGAITAPSVLFLGYWFIIPESPRWLLVHKRFAEAEKIIFQIAKINKVSLDRSQISDLLSQGYTNQPEEENPKRATMLDIFKYKQLRKRSFVIFIDWFALNVSYYGLSWNTSNLGGNDFLNFFIAGTVELPAYIFLILTLNRWGRKILLCGSMFIGGCFLLATSAVPNDLTWLTVTFSMIGKFAVAGGYSVVYIFTVEQYPTVIRNAGLGAASTLARFGAILAPFINATSDYWKPIPMIVFGVMILLGAGLSLTLPETLHKKLPETLEEGEQFGKNVIV